MRKADETRANLPAFYRLLRDVGVGGERLTVCYATFRDYVLEVLGYTWPYERRVGIKIDVTSRSR